MRLKELLQLEFVKGFDKLLVTEFEKQLFVSSLRNYCSHGNPMRFHNFAFAMRELVLRVIDRKAPDSEVVKAIWYKKESEDRDVTRRQKLKYCAQKRLSDSFFCETELDDLNDSIRKYLKEFQFFNKYTHVTEKYFKVCAKGFHQDFENIVIRSKNVVKDLTGLEGAILGSIPDTLRDDIFDVLINDFPSDLSLIASNVVVGDVQPEELSVNEIGDEFISINVTGSVEVDQEYGKHEDFTSFSASYPFSASISISVTDPKDIRLISDDINVDVSSWYGDEDDFFLE